MLLQFLFVACQSGLFKASNALTGIERYQCGVNIEGNKFDLSPFMPVGQNLTMEHNDYTYTVSICQTLDPNYLPGNMGDTNGLSAMRCATGTNDCEPVGYHLSQDYGYINPAMKESGFYISHVSPSKDTSDDYYEFKTVHEFYCDPTANSFVPYDVISFNDKGIFQVSFLYKHSAACAEKVTPPTPTPLPPTGICSRRVKSSEFYPFAINLQLDDLNYAQYGYPIELDKDNLAMVMPCGTSKCPIGYTCDRTNASIWLCNQGKTCKAYGNVYDTMELSKIGVDPVEGFSAIYKDTKGHNTKLDLVCDFDVPSDSIYLQSVEFDDLDYLHIKARSSSACMKPYDEVQPDDCSAKVEVGGKKYPLDIAQWNVRDAYIFDVDVIGMTDYHNHIEYQPCDAMNCPEATCTGENGATVWFCTKEGERPADCTQFGSFNGQKSIDSYTSPDRTGVTVTYRSESARQSKVRIFCNSSLPPGQLSFHKNALVEGWRTLHFSAESSDVCFGVVPSPTPTPTPAPAPTPTPVPIPLPTPTPTAAPTPTYLPDPPLPVITPEPSDRTSRVFGRVEGDRAVSFNYEELFVDLFYSYKSARFYDNRGNSADGRFFYFPFGESKRPFFGRSPYSGGADAWGCWGKAPQTKCYPLGFHKQGATIETGYPIDYGARFSLHGLNNYVTHFDLRCEKDAYDTIIDGAIRVEGNHFYVRGTSPHVCAYTVKDPNHPYKPERSSHDQELQVSVFNRDLSTVGTQNITIPDYVIHGFNEATTLHVSPGKTIPCPTPFRSCGGHTSANVWRCTNVIDRKPLCLPVGDTHYGIQQATTNIVYPGAYSNYSTRIQLRCDKSVPGNTFTILEGAYELNNEVNLELASSMFCFDNSASFGGVFLFLIIFPLVLYLSLGMLWIYFREGTVSIPNKEFWSSVTGIIVLGFNRIFSRGQSRGANQYDEI